MKRLRIATFNMENLDDRPAAVALEDRIAVMRPQLERLRADIVCLQEINGHSQSKHGPRTVPALDALVAGTDYAGYHRAISLNLPGTRIADRHNLVILSRLPILEQGQVRHDLVPPPVAGGIAQEWDRPLLHAAIALPSGRLLRVVNLHLRAPRAAPVAGQKDAAGHWLSVGGWAEGFFHAAIRAAGQALEARLLVERMFDDDPGALIAVCGDLNADDREAPLRILRGDEEDTGNGHLAARMLVPVERSLPESQRYSVVHHGRRIMLDHILISRGLLGWYRGAEIHNETLGDELVSPLLIGGSPESYHAPLVADFLQH